MNRRTEPMDTHEILLRSRAGDPESFRTLVEHYQGYALRLARRILRSEEDAKDTVQDTFVRVWQNLDRFDPRTRFTTWLYRIVTNLCLDRLKADRRRAAALEAGRREPDPIGLGHRQATADRGLIAAEAARDIVELSTSLPPAQRVVFILRDVEDLSMSETCAATGMGRGSVKSNLYHARRALRAMMNAPAGSSAERPEEEPTHDV